MQEQGADMVRFVCVTCNAEIARHDEPHPQAPSEELQVI
jgi:hypothetical protein